MRNIYGSGAFAWGLKFDHLVYSEPLRALFELIEQHTPCCSNSAVDLFAPVPHFKPNEPESMETLNKKNVVRLTYEDEICLKRVEELGKAYLGNPSQNRSRYDFRESSSTEYLCSLEPPLLTKGTAYFSSDQDCEQNSHTYYSLTSEGIKALRALRRKPPLTQDGESDHSENITYKASLTRYFGLIDLFNINFDIEAALPNGNKSALKARK